MSIWLLHLIFACILCYYKKVSADAIRGVNLGGWLLTEEWYVVWQKQPISIHSTFAC